MGTYNSILRLISPYGVYFYHCRYKQFHHKNKWIISVTHTVYINRNFINTGKTLLEFLENGNAYLFIQTIKNKLVYESNIRSQYCGVEILWVPVFKMNIISCYIFPVKLWLIFLGFKVPKYMPILWR